MCFCCPPAISALFCLYVQSGCNHGSVAAALAFFPPDPPLYKMERLDKDGNSLPDSDTTNNDGQASPEEHNTNNNSSSSTTNANTTGRVEHIEDRDKSPAQQLTERAQMLRQRAKTRNARDQQDVRDGVQYRFVLDPRLMRPPERGMTVEAIKVPSKRGVHLATVICRVPNPTSTTRTLLYSHGNATDVGAMFQIQTVLSQSLQCNVVSYDYSGFGESGGTMAEQNTYTDIQSVYDYILDTKIAADPSRVVLYGQSVGSGPSCYLASKNRDVGGMILHSAFTSGMRVLTPSR